MRYLIIALVFALLLGLLDYYVFYNWRRFALYRKWPLRIATHVYHMLVFVMPITLPVFLFFTRWWEVEPKLLRAVVLGVWAIYYVPKIPIALVLMLKDASKLVTWMFRRFQRSARETAVDPEQAHHRPDLADVKTMNRAEFIRKMGWGAASIPFVYTGYSLFRSLYDFRVERVIVPVADLPTALDGLTIAQISDLHAGSFFSARPIEEAIDITNSLRPDLLTVTGDFVNHDAAELDVALPALGRLRADLGVYACLGNHEHYARVGEVMNRLAILPLKMLVNQHEQLRIGGATLYLIGTDNTGFNQNFADLPAATAGIPPERDGSDFRMLMTHDPSFWDAVRAERPDVDLTLCGHTHGGQLGFEIGPLRWSLARIAYARWAGLYSEDRPDGRSAQYLYVNRGLGTVGPPLRMGVRPEVTLLTLQRV